jgi:signal transduction histidine kinase
VLDSAVGLLQARLDELALQVNRNRLADDAFVTGDRDALVQAITELLSNSMDQVPRGGRIDVYSRRISGSDRRFTRVAIGVADSGPGIADEIKPLVCDLFYTQKAGGNGIGLASVQRAVEQHGGEIFIADVVPHGADVGMVLPAVG